MSEFDLVLDLLEKIRARREFSCLEDDLSVLSGLEATEAVLAHAETLGRMTSNRGYVLLALPNSVALGVLTLACLAAGRIPVVCNPWARNWQGFIDDGLPIELAIYSGAERSEQGIGFEAIRICLKRLSFISVDDSKPDPGAG